MKNIIQEEFKIKLIIIIYILKSIFESTNNSINNRIFFLHYELYKYNNRNLQPININIILEAISRDMKLTKITNYIKIFNIHILLIRQFCRFSYIGIHNIHCA